jgi:hypothetical protein
VRKDTREKPFLCQCGASFTRRDLLTRHWRITGHSEIGVADTQQTQETHAVPQHDIGTTHVLDAVPTVPENGMLENASQTHRPDLPTPVASFQDVQGHVDPALHEQTYQDDGFEDFRDFVNFIDGVGLSAQWTPEYDIDWMRLDNYQESRRPSREPESRHSPGNEDIGTPFSTWLPSAPAEDQVQLRSHSGEGMCISLFDTSNKCDGAPLVLDDRSPCLGSKFPRKLEHTC